MEIKGYKGFDKDLKCRDFQYEVGKEYKHDGEIELCSEGFHFCKRLMDIHGYYDLKDENTRVCEILASGNIIEGDDKCVTDTIKIVRELSKEEIEELKNVGEGNTGVGNTGYRNTGNWNTGNRNTGDSNTGDRNTGDSNTGYSNTGYRNTGNLNTGDRNTGDSNTGDSNTGDRNTGDRNTGDSNTGYRNTGNLNTGDWNTGYRNTGYLNTGNLNTGDRNTGDRNTGNLNTGDWNTTDRATGCFCTEKQPMKFFDKKSDMTWEQWRDSRAYYILRRIPKSVWIDWEDMTEEEQQQNPKAKITGGFMRELDLKEEAEKWWANLDDEEKETIRAMPNFNRAKFRKIMKGAKIG